MARQSRSRFPTRSQAHRSSWEAGPETSGGGGPQLLASSIANLATVSVQATVDSLTLIRTRGFLHMWLETAVAAGDGFYGAFGIAKATSAAVLAGAASVPTPITEEAWDGWLYHQYFGIHAAGPIAVATAAQEALQNAGVTAAFRNEVDSKAMRKQDVNEAIYAAVEVVMVGTAAMRWQFNCRLLVKDMG